MLIKFMTCKPIKGKENAFSQAQEAWQDIAHCDGLIGQFGGWDTLSSQALILALWRDQASINHFMNDIHDGIVDKNQQYLTYKTCAVSYLTIKMTIPSQTIRKEIDLSKIGFIRMANCLLFPDRHDQFLADQTAVWNPAMSACAGMLGGYVGNFIKEPNKYLVISFWEDEYSHQDYINNIFPTLRNKVDINTYIQELTGHQVLINKAWHVLPRKGI